ncbi:MAG: hypothetical protein J5545_06070 [Bacteroidaceae bacterium]|nr:hypothetical protein [Bacteroidaceae bacterium]
MKTKFRFLLTTLLLAVLPVKLLAADGQFDSPTQAFSWYSKGPGCMHLKLLSLEHSANRTLDKATYFLKDSSGERIEVLYLHEKDSYSKEKTYVRSEMMNKLPGESLLYLTNDTYWKPLCYVWGVEYQEHDHTRNTTSENCYAEFDWYFPVRFYGQKMTFCVEGKINDRGGHLTDYSKEIGTMEFDDITFETYDAVPGTEAGDEATIRIPFYCDHVINSVSATYTDRDGNEQTLPEMTIEKDSYFGFLNIPATEKVTNLKLTANIRSASIDKANIPQSNWPAVLNGDITKTIEKVGLIHNPRMLKATVDSVGAVKLQWKVFDRDAEDLLEGDIFQVQRSLTGKTEDFKNLESTEMYDKDKENYEFTDSTLMSSLSAAQIDQKLGIPLVRYRVFRATTNEIWGLEKNPTVAYVQPQFSTLTLLQPKDAAVVWSNQEERKVKVTWNWMENDASHNYVWDDRAEMRLEVKMFNRSQQLVDSISTTLTDAQFRQREVELTLNRSCVTYEMRLIVDGSQSPIGRGEGNIFKLIGSKRDFELFADILFDGKPSAIPNAIMTADITIDSEIANYWLGYKEDKPYTGNFNGNGYTLTFDYPELGHRNDEYLAPVRFAGKGAVFCNLTTAGTVRNEKRFAAGFVGKITTGELHIENCISNVNFRPVQSGDMSMGGFVGIIDLNNGSDNTKSLRISNSMFGGDFVLTSLTTHCGGFVGWRRRGTYGMLSNCYLRPLNYNGSFRGWQNFMRDLGQDPQFGIIQDCCHTGGYPDSHQGKLSSTAPQNWCWENGKPAVKQVAFSTPYSGSVTELVLPEGKFYYENLGHINKDSLTVETQQSSVVLRWQNVDEEPVDYYEVWRRDVLAPNDSVCLATQLIDMQYEDKTTSPVHTYEYRVRGVNDCEGQHSEATNWVTGHCVQTGRVSGYVRFPDGTGIPGVPVIISNGSTTWEVTTDESGYFMRDSLPYWNNGGESAYDVTPRVAGYEGVRSISFRTVPGSNQVSNVEFLIEQSVKFSGYVRYFGTSIPAQGVSFLVDGYEVRTAAGKVTSDFEGSFSFRMLPNVQHSIQAVKDGHTFYQNGFYHADEKDPEDKIMYDFPTDKAGVYFYDDTRVTLIGRVAGGREQAEIPLGNSLSKNNLGDDLKMVFVLEGDNASQLVFDVTDRTKKERDEVFTHKAHDSKYTYQTRVHTTSHRVEVTPDVHTGEYMVKLPPVKWKIQQITARGYATLFQDGQTGDVIDLTDSIRPHTDHYEGAWANANRDTIRSVDVEYHAQYNRIYRTPVLLERKQVGFDKFDYFGDRIYTAQSLVGDKVKVPLVYQAPKAEYLKDKKKWVGKDSLEVRYTFGHPVFNTERGYPLLLSAVERYYYNNNVKTDTVDVVKLSGGVVTVRNGLVSGTHRETVKLDENGEATYVLTAAQRPYLVTGDNALCTVNFTMERDGVTYEGEPIKAFTLSQYVKQGAKDYMSFDAPILVDVLRDPPGGGSSAKLSKGSTLKLTYQMDMSWKAGLNFNISAGSKLSTYSGVAALAIESGILNLASSDFTVGFDLCFSGSGQRAFSYTMTANEDISTDAGSTMVGADADVYMGVVTNVYLRPTVAIRAIPDSTFVHKSGELVSGDMVEIAQGYDEQGGLFHLVRDESVGYGQKVKSNFIHSQQYIVKQLIPNLAERSMSLIYSGTTPEKARAEAQTLADATGKRVYLSLRDKKDPKFGLVNTDSITGQYIYNSTRHPYEGSSKLNYLIVVPNGDNDDSKRDEVNELTQLMGAWFSIIQQNEKEKLEATELVKNFDVDGGGTMSYSEDFASDYTNAHTFTSAFAGMNHNYFDWDDPNNKPGAGDVFKNVVPSLVGIFGQLAGSILGNLLKMDGGSTGISGVQEKNKGADDQDYTVMEFSFLGTSYKMKITPMIAYNVVPKQSINTKYNRKESFTIKMDKKSHLNFDVYRVKTIDTSSNDDVNAIREGNQDVFLETNFARNVEYVKYFLDRGVGAYEKGDFSYPKSFVYRTRAGATVRPWENERKTITYHKGTVLDERTKKIENPIIKMDKQSISGVPVDQPARFKLYMTNESEQPEAIGGALQFYTLYLDDTSNPKGARLLVDGMPLSRAGMTIKAVPGEVTEKTMEVWAGEDFDYDNLKIGLISQGDVQCVQEVAFSVHFLRQAGAVDIAMPGDKWIMNTDAPYDSIRGWYMPVIISGFNKTQANFDHIEFQYKESTRGDDYWTNLCGFYNDSTLYAAASGTKEMIPANGYIQTRFYGDGKVMEKAYDLRARLFCRNGNSFVTSDSKVLTGVKDTRRPQLFGTVEPKDGILGAGDNIVFNFSENIEYNYLQTDNFEVMGETNETAVQEEPALLFSGGGYAQSEARRNFADKNMTVEVLIKPDNTGKAMPIFSHGTDGKKLQLWLTADKKLMAVVDGRSLVSDAAINIDGYRQVALVVNNDSSRVSLIGENFECSMDSVTYSGYGPVFFGSTNQTDVSQREFYSGRMLQGRIWNRALNSATLNLYAKKLLTGYEMGLTDYYPMNDGDGDYAADQAQGAHLKLTGTSWAQPRGMALKLNRDEQREVKGMQVRSERFSRTDEQDYTLMFWFKTDNNGRGALFSNGAGQTTDTDARNKFFIGFEGPTLKYRTNGAEYPLGDTFSDDKWHHYAMTVNRSHQVASIYVDNNLKAQFATDSLGGMTGENFYFGNMVWYESGLHDDVLHQNFALTGWLDGICLFEQALPPTLIRRYSEKSVGGLERGLVTFLGFNRQERQQNNEYTLHPYPLSQKIYVDEGTQMLRRDTVFYDSIQYVIDHIDQNYGAPMQAYQELRNLNFSFVGRNNQLLVNIDERDARINKRQVFVTVYDIPDLNGNYMASPAMTEAFVDRNPLRWSQKTYKEIIQYDATEDVVFDINVINSSGAPHTFKVENMPKWLSVSEQTDIVDAKSERTLTFTISRDTNVGTYDDIIYLTDEDGLSEPLMLNITIEADQPLWYVDSRLKQYSMSIIGRVKIGNDIVTDSHDIVGVFDAMGRCMGTGNVNYDPASAESLVYLTVYDSMTVERPLGFKLWHYETGKTMVLTPSETILFKPESFRGTTKEPIILMAGSQYVQTISLYPGWNWISLNVTTNAYRDVEKLLSWYPWQEDDMLTDENDNLSLLYHDNKWISNKGSYALSDVMLSVGKSYRVKVANAVEVEIVGDAPSAVGDRTIHVKNGWNSIGYTPMVNLPVATALADYLEEAQDGDLVKSKTEFAMFTTGDKGSREWKGNLKYMKPGEGYMLYRQKPGDVTFTYPYYEPNATFFQSSGGARRAPSRHARNMSLTAITDGIELQEGDRLVAFTAGERVGETLVGTAWAADTSEPLYLSISGDTSAPVSFGIERDGEIIALTPEVLHYQPDAISGSPARPTKIHFTQRDSRAVGDWYSVQGFKLGKRPAQKGVYINNGQKQVIK